MSTAHIVALPLFLSLFLSPHILICRFFVFVLVLSLSLSLARALSRIRTHYPDWQPGAAGQEMIDRLAGFQLQCLRKDAEAAAANTAAAVAAASAAAGLGGGGAASHWGQSAGEYCSVFGEWCALAGQRWGRGTGGGRGEGGGRGILRRLTSGFRRGCIFFKL